MSVVTNVCEYIRVRAALGQLLHRQESVALHAELHLRDLRIRATILKTKWFRCDMVSFLLCCIITHFEVVRGDAKDPFLLQPLAVHQGSPQRHQHLGHRACNAYTYVTTGGVEHPGGRGVGS